MSKTIPQLQAERAAKIEAAEKLLPSEGDTMTAEAQTQAGELLAAAESLQADIDAAVRAQAAVQDMRTKLSALRYCTSRFRIWKQRYEPNALR